MGDAEFSRASRAVWEAMASGWSARHSYFEEISEPVTRRMLERLAPSPGDAILDLASGSGLVGFAAASLVGPEGHVTVSDFAGGMVDGARRRAAKLGLANVDCRVLDAEALDLPDDSADGVLCRWGYMLMGDPVAALSETRRVLRPGGRLAFAVFGEAERNPWAALPARALRERGHMPEPAPGAPGILALADRERLRALVTGAGFPEPAIDEVPFTWHFDGPSDFWDFLTDAAGAIASVLDRLDDGERDRVRQRIEELIEPFGAPGRLELPALSLVVSTP